MNDHWHYASEVHGAAEEHHRHHDLEREVDALQRTADELVREVREIRAALADHARYLSDARDRIRQLEQQTPESRQAEYEADVATADSEPWRDTLADYQVASGVTEYVDEDEP